MTESSDYPSRRRLPHEIPGWVRQGARHFITLGAEERSTRPFAPSGVADLLLQSLLNYDARQRWYLWQAVIMPDHLHFMATFPLDQGIQQTIAQWKRYHSRIHGLHFQADFFEHRLRTEGEFSETWDYIRQNPVRQHLASAPETWPWLWERSAP